MTVRPSPDRDRAAAVPRAHSGSTASCKFALCAVDGGKGAGNVVKGALILTPVNTHCGGKMGADHGACFFLAQLPTCS